jgi:DNA-directed RNA polymerase specialized sigma subunit
MKNNKREKVWSERYVFGDVGRDQAVREIAEKLGISRSYVSRIEKSALEKLKSALGG